MLKNSDTHESEEDSPAICLKIDNFIFRLGNIVSLLSIVLIAVILLQVIARYVFNINSIAVEELQWHLYAVFIMFGLSYAMVNNAHVRVDILRNNFTKKTQSIIEVFGLLFLTLPFIYIIIEYGIEFTQESYRVNERSNAVDGLSHLWIIKSIIPLSFMLLALATFSKLIHNINIIIKTK